MKEFKLPRKTLFLWQIRTVLLWMFLSLFCWFCAFSMKLFLILICVLTVLLAFTTLFYLPQFYKLCKIKFVKGGIIVETGVFIRNCHILPFSRLIYTQTIVSPLARVLNLSAITLKAARSRIYIPEIDNSDLETLLNLLTKGEEE